MSIREKKAPLSLPRCPVCNSQATILKSVNFKGVPQEWEVVCDQDDHFIRVSGLTEADAIEEWRRAFSRESDYIKLRETKIFSKLKSFQDLYGFVLNPIMTYDLESWSKLIARIGHCPCHSDRKSCPCSQSVDEINAHGNCSCGLFFDNQSEVYKDLVIAAAGGGGK